MTVFVCYSVDPDCEPIGPVFSLEEDAEKYCEKNPSYTYDEVEVDLEKEWPTYNNAIGVIHFGMGHTDCYYLGSVSVSAFNERNPESCVSVCYNEYTNLYKLVVKLSYDSEKISLKESKLLVANATKELGMELLRKLQAGYTLGEMKYYAANKRFNQSELWEG